LFGLSDVAVTHVEAAPGEGRVVEVVTADAAAARGPDCGTASKSVKANVTTRPKDLPYGQAPLQVMWRTRRWRCRQRGCERQSFTEQITEPAGARTTGRLRRATVRAVIAGRSVSEVAAAHAVSWPRVQRAVNPHAKEAEREQRAPTALLDIDQTRFGAVRWGPRRRGIVDPAPAVADRVGRAPRTRTTTAAKDW
jgi:transposase